MPIILEWIGLGLGVVLLFSLAVFVHEWGHYWVARMCGMRIDGFSIGSNDLISMEIGGTSCDVLLMSDGVIGFTDALSIGGYDVVTRSVDVHTIGAGGGTIASVAEGMLTIMRLSAEKRFSQR